MPTCSFFQPLIWQHPYVPVLARDMLDFLMAPTAFLMGCHLSHFEEVAAVSAHSSKVKFPTQDIRGTLGYCCFCLWPQPIYTPSKNNKVKEGYES